jgi:hypothetical protein
VTEQHSTSMRQSNAPIRLDSCIDVAISESDKQTGGGVDNHLSPPPNLFRPSLDQLRKSCWLQTHTKV